MDTTSNDKNRYGQAEAMADKAVGKVQSGIDQAGSTLADSVDSARRKLNDGISNVSDQVGSAAKQMGDTAARASESIILYTKENPVKALTIAAVSGALLVLLMKALTPSRED